MPEIIYQDPILKKYADLITASTNKFKRIYYGDPIRIGVSELPALIISKIGTRVTNHNNVEDLHEVSISFTVVTDVRDTISDDKDMVSGVNSLYNLIEGRKADDYSLREDSLLYILRHSVELDSKYDLRTDFNTATKVDYGMTMGKRKPDAWAIEGTVEITANFSADR